MPRIVPLVLLLSAAPAACGEAPATFSPEVRVALADVCVIGTVTEIEKEPVQAKTNPGAADPTPFTVAVVKVEANVHGAKNVTHVRVGFLSPNGRRNPPAELKVDQKVCLFLNRLPDAPIAAIPFMSPPVEVNDANAEIVARVKRMAAVYADPLKALKADRAEDRAFAAACLVSRYLQPRTNYLPATTEPIPAEESKAILAALAEADWTAGGGALSIPVVVQHLGLTAAQGFSPPQPKPGQDANLLLRDEFKRWAANEGGKYTIKKIVPKAK